MDGLILQISERLLREVIGATGPQGEIFDALSQPFAVIYRLDGAPSDAMLVEGFGDQELLSAWLEQRYRGIEVVAVIRAGKPVKFNMRVKARIG
jgi:hypothetical protein